VSVVVDHRSDRELRKVKKDSLKTLQRLQRLDSAKAAREGKIGTLVAEGEAARTAFTEARLELQRRRSEATLTALAKDQEARAGLTLEPFQRLGVRLGLALNPNRLTASERKEFLRLSPEDDRVQFEALAEKAGAAPGFFEERRQEQAAKAKLAELTRQGREEAARDVFLPGRVFSWPTEGAPASPHGLWEHAILAVLIDAFANNRAPAQGGTFEDGWLVLTEDFEFFGCEWPNDPMRCRAALARLSANGLLVVEKKPGRLLVTLAKDAQRL
jgi:hypothetical protein